MTTQILVIPFDRQDVREIRTSTEEASLVDRTCQNPVTPGDEEEFDHD